MCIPRPTDLSNTRLEPGLCDLIETIAENAHEVWAKKRIEQGWTYGSERSGELKTTPCLVPYSQLPESEKEYDRETASQTLKLTITYPEGDKRKESVYDGEWKDGSKNGTGTETVLNSDGSTSLYEGMFAGGKYEGEGKLTKVNHDGVVYECDGKFSGGDPLDGSRYTYYSASGEITRTGTIRNGEKADD